VTFRARLGSVVVLVAALVAAGLAASHWGPLVSFLQQHPQPVGPDGYWPDGGRPDRFDAVAHVARIMLPIVAAVIAIDVVRRRRRERARQRGR
jgi:hypothetical protein